MTGIPVTIVDKGGIPVKPVEARAPVMTVSERGVPVTISDRGAPFIIQGYNVWSPADLFADGEFGTWYDPSFLDTLFQDATGSTPAVPGSPVGLVLDAREELGPELITGWQAAATYTPTTFSSSGSGFIAEKDSAAISAAIVPDEKTLTIGAYYAVEVHLNSSSRAHNFSFVNGATGAGGTRSNIITLPATETPTVVRGFLIPTQSNIYIQINNGGSFVSSIDVASVTIREVLNLPLSQPTTAARPILARMPKTGRRNLLTWTEDASQWVASGSSHSVTFAAAGDDFFKATVADDASGSSVAFSSIYPIGTSATSDITIVRSVEVRPDVGATHVLVGPSSALSRAIVRLSDGEISYQGSSVAKVDVSPLDGGGWRIETWTDISSSSATASSLQSGVGWGVWSSGSTFDPGNAGQSILVRKPSFAVVEGLGFEDSIPYQHVRSAYDITEVGVPDCYSLVYDLADDNLTTTLPQAINGDILIAGTKGSIIEPVSYAAGSTFTLGPDTYTGGTTGIMRALGDIVGVVLIDRTLTQTERENLLRHYRGKGAKGLLVPGPELVVNGDFSDGLSNYTPRANTTASVSGGRLILGLDGVGAGITGTIQPLSLDRVYIVKSDTQPVSFSGMVHLGVLPSPGTSGVNNLTTFQVGTEGVAIFIPPNVNSVFYLSRATAVTGQLYVNRFSVRELRPQEDWL